MASRAENLDPVVKEIRTEAPALTFDEWLELLAERESVDLGMTAAELLAEARDAGEV